MIARNATATAVIRMVLISLTIVAIIAVGDTACWAKPEIHWVNVSADAETGQVVLKITPGFTAADPFDVSINWAYGNAYGPTTVEAHRCLPGEPYTFKHRYDALHIKKYDLKTVTVYLNVSNPNGKDNWKVKVTLPDPK